MTASVAVGAISSEFVALASARLALLLDRVRSGKVAHCALFATSDPDGESVERSIRRLKSLLEFTSVLESIAIETGFGHLGLEMANIDQQHEAGIFKSLAVCAPTVGAAIEDLVRLFPLIQTGTTVRLEQDGSSARFIYNIREHWNASSLQDSAYTLGKLFHRFRRAAGEQWCLDHVTIAASAPRSAHIYSEFFQAPVKFGCDVSSLCFPTSVLATPIPTVDHQCYEALRRDFERRLRARGDEDVIEDALRAWLRHIGSCRELVSIESAAADFGVTPRTLQRRLKDRGTSFLDLRAQVRMATARLLLADSAVAITSIADQIGFSEVSAFTRAFRKHAGQSPSAFRRDVASWV